MMVFDKTGEMLSEIYKEGMAPVTLHLDRDLFQIAEFISIPPLLRAMASNRSAIYWCLWHLPALSGWDFGNFRSIPCVIST